MSDKDDDSWLRQQPLSDEEIAQSYRSFADDPIDHPKDVTQVYGATEHVLGFDRDDEFSSSGMNLGGLFRNPVVIIAALAIIVLIGVALFFHPGQQNNPPQRGVATPIVVVALHSATNANPSNIPTPGGSTNPNSDATATAISINPGGIVPPTAAAIQGTTGTGQGGAPTTPPNKPVPTNPPVPVYSGTIISNVAITWYDFNDNSCPNHSTGCDAIAFPNNQGYPTPHNGATEGQGTYNDPITLSGGYQNSSLPAEFALGEKVYVAPLHKYFVMEDQCFQCYQQWAQYKAYSIDLWVGPPYGSSALDNCEGRLPSGPATIVANPSNNYPVDTAPLFANNACVAHSYSNSLP